METILQYAIQVILCSGILFLCYKLLLDGKTDFVFCRIFLLFALVLSALIPAIKIPVFSGGIIEVGADAIMSDTAVADTYQGFAPEAGAKNGLVFLCGAYFLVSLFFIFSLIIQFFKTSSYKKISRKAIFNGIGIYESEHIKTPFTFFRNIFIPSSLQPADKEQIITHELSHAHHNHSLELLLLEVIKALMWFNPFVWLTRSALIEVHEYEADDAVLRNGHDTNNYKNLLFRQFFGFNPDISSGLACSKTKKRFIMMDKKKPGPKSTIRSLAILPAIAALLIMFSFTTKEPQIVEQTPQLNTPATEGKVYYFLGDEEIDAQAMQKINPDNIERIHVIKDEGKKHYGKDDAEGIVVIHMKENNIEEPFMVVENMPQFQNGTSQKFGEWLKSKLRSEEVLTGLSGTLGIEFIVEKDGNVDHVKIIETPSASINQKVIDAVKSSPRWTPGKQRGQEVRVKQIVILNL